MARARIHVFSLVTGEGIKVSDLQPIRIDLICVGCGASGNAPHPTATREIVDQLRLDGAKVLD